MFHKLEQLKFKMEKIIGIEKHARKVRKDIWRATHLLFSLSCRRQTFQALEKNLEKQKKSMTDEFVSRWSSKSAMGSKIFIKRHPKQGK